MLANLFRSRLSYSFLILIIYILIVVPLIGDSSIYFYISSLYIVSSIFNFSWAHEIFENYNIIMIVRALTKLIYVLFILNYILTRNDILIYLLGMIFFDALYYIVTLLILLKGEYILFLKNVIFMKSRVKISSLAPLALSSMIVSLIAYFPSLILGKCGFMDELGNYSVALRFFSIGTYLITPLSIVMKNRTLMKVNESLENNNAHFNLSFNVLITLSLVIMTGLILSAEDVISLFVGSEYLKSINVLRLYSLSLLFTTISGFYGGQIIFASNRDHLILKGSIFSLLIMIISGLIFIPRFQSLGASISVLMSSSSLAFIYWKFSKTSFFDKKLLKDIVKCFIAIILMCAFLILVDISTITQLLFKVVGAGLIYFISLFILKHSIIRPITNNILLTFSDLIKKH